MILLGELAQQIVDNIMPLVNQNVNIMDHHGIIIGSGQKYRINTFHKGANDVICSGQTVEIYPEEIELYPGSQPGVNLPIVLEGQIIGVVGISGHPDHVRNNAQIIKVVAELILERELLREEFRSHSKLQEQFAESLLSESPVMSYEKLQRIAKLLNFDLSLIRFVTVIDIKFREDTLKIDLLHDLVIARMREKLIQTLVSANIISQQDLAVFLEDKLVIIKHLYIEKDCIKKTQEVWGQEILQLLNTLYAKPPINIGIGGLAKTYAELSCSYREALSALDTFCSNSICSIYNLDILVSFLMQNITNSQPCLPLEELREKINIKIGTDLHTTIKCLLDNNLNIAHTAKVLYIHRNTLLFRLEKLKQVTGLDPCHSINHAFLCKMLF